MRFIKKHYRLIIVFIVVLLLLLAGRSYIQSKDPKNGYQTIKATKNDITKIVSASGKIASGKEVDLKFQTSGLLTWVGVKLGDKVTSYQTIAQLDKRELELTLQKYLRDYSKERWDFEEDKQVTYRNTALTDTIKRILEKNQYDLDKAVMDVELKDIALRFATLTTPIAGIVTQIDTPVAGINITPATAIFKVSDPDQLLFKADVDEVDIGLLKKGQKAGIIFDAYPETTYNAVITRIDFTASTTSGGSTAFTVEVSMPDNPDLKFRLGMNGDVDFIISEKKNTLIVPIETIQGKTGKNFVYVLENNKKVKKPVDLGIQTDSEAEILAGIKEDDMIIINVQD